MKWPSGLHSCGADMKPSCREWSDAVIMGIWYSHIPHDTTAVERRIDAVVWIYYPMLQL
jgi:hypothetical protein